MKFSAALLTIIAATGANAFWEVPEEHQGSSEKLQKYFSTFPGCMSHCETYFRSEKGGSHTNTAQIQTNCLPKCKEIFGLD